MTPPYFFSSIYYRFDRYIKFILKGGIIMHPAIHAVMTASAVSANRRRRERQEQQEKEQLKEDTEKKAMDEYCQRHTDDTYCIQEYIPAKERAINSKKNDDTLSMIVVLIVIAIFVWFMLCEATVNKKQN